mmetsp:Transcript_56917/g.144334  ORF Transcript_56917/g.144334 Transcript_56917/m.144334 type:complete len:212 (+) Transcript_56917:441-1076(+)
MPFHGHACKQVRQDLDLRGADDVAPSVGHSAGVQVVRSYCERCRPLRERPNPDDVPIRRQLAQEMLPPLLEVGCEDDIVLIDHEVASGALLVGLAQDGQVGGVARPISRPSVVPNMCVHETIHPFQFGRNLPSVNRRSPNDGGAGAEAFEQAGEALATNLPLGHRQHEDLWCLEPEGPAPLLAVDHRPHRDVRQVDARPLRGRPSLGTIPS